VFSTERRAISLPAMAVARLLLVGAALLTPALRASTIVYTDSATFFNQLGVLITDQYTSPGYAFTQTDAQMDAVFNETQYDATGNPNTDIVFDDEYCGGCNGSFLLSFDHTTLLDSSNGVFGVGMEIANNDGGPFYDAFVTFGDGSTANFTLPTGTPAGFWGITSSLDVSSIAFGLADGGTTTAGAFSITDLTIGSAESPVPEPKSLLGLAAALLAMFLYNQQRSRHFGRNP
jgi:hypothetical protein